MFELENSNIMLMMMDAGIIYIWNVFLQLFCSAPNKFQLYQEDTIVGSSQLYQEDTIVGYS